MCEEMGSGGMNELHTGIVADNVDMPFVVGGEAAGEGREMRQGFRERKFEEGN